MLLPWKTPSNNVPDCLAGLGRAARFGDCGSPSTWAPNTEKVVRAFGQAARETGAIAVRMDDFFCPDGWCPGTLEDGSPTFVDGFHVYEGYNRALAPRFAALLGQHCVDLTTGSTACRSYPDLVA